MKNIYRRSFFIVTATLLFGITASAQNSTKSVTINLGLSAEGYGFPNYLYEQPQRNFLPTLNLYGEYFLGKIFSVGFYSAYTYNYYKFHDYVYPSDSYKDNWRGWDLGLRYMFHLNPILIKTDKIDLYAAGFSGYTSRSLVYDKKNIYRDTLNYNIDALSVGGLLGGRYFISKHVGVYGEAGFSRQLFLGAGVTYKLTRRATE
jgi:hypothetical protein